MSEQTFEMLWDCSFCEQKKNLGLTHRFCPNCGGMQNADKRYFPSDDEKVAVEDHEFVGADRQCSYCQAFTSSRANNCGNCGGALAEGADAKRRGDQVSATGFAGENAADAVAEFARRAVKGALDAPPKKRRLWPWIVGGLALASFAFLGVMCLWKRDAAATVTGHSWTRSVAVERYGPQRTSAWCDALPSGAMDVTRRREVRSHKNIKDGETCKTRRIDNGDGTFREKQECRPKFRKEPVYDDKCHFKINQWKRVRSAEAKGDALAPAPKWPEPKLAKAGSCVGCERAGPRSETYKVFLDVEGDAHDCEIPEAKWASMAVGSTAKLKMRVIGDGIDCDSLR
jgi:hypothetical protein